MSLVGPSAGLLYVLKTAWAGAISARQGARPIYSGPVASFRETFVWSSNGPADASA